MQVKKTVLTASNIYSLTNQFEILPAPSSGNVNVVYEIGVFRNSGTAYNNGSGGTPAVYATGDNPNAEWVHSNILANTSDTISKMIPYGNGGVVYSGALYALTFQTPQTGTGNLTFYVVYEEITTN